MYVTYSDLIQIGIFIVTLIGLCYTIFGRKKFFKLSRVGRVSLTSPSYIYNIAHLTTGGKQRRIFTENILCGI